MNYAYITRFHRTHHVVTTGGRFDAHGFFDTSSWGKLVLILEDTEILEELIQSRSEQVARAARLLQVLSLNYSSPFITTPARIQDSVRQWAMNPLLAKAIENIPEDPASGLAEAERVTENFYCTARNSYRTYLVEALSRLSDSIQYDPQAIYLESRRLEEKLHCAKLMNKEYFLAQERKKITLPDRVTEWDQFSKDLLPDGYNIVMFEPRKTKAARQHETLTPTIVSGRRTEKHQINEDQHHRLQRMRTREATYINVDELIYDRIRSPRKATLGQTNRTLPLDIAAAN